MIDIEKALAEALEHHGLDFWYETGNEDARDGYTEVSFNYGALAAFILATEPMQAIARQAAIGAAVERLEREFYPLRAIVATSGSDGWVFTAEGYDQSGLIVYRRGKSLDSLPVAIEEALRHD